MFNSARLLSDCNCAVGSAALRSAANHPSWVATRIKSASSCHCACYADQKRSSGPSPFFPIQHPLPNNSLEIEPGRTKDQDGDRNHRNVKELITFQLDQRWKKTRAQDSLSLSKEIKKKKKSGRGGKRWGGGGPLDGNWKFWKRLL